MAMKCYNSIMKKLVQLVLLGLSFLLPAAMAQTAAEAKAPPPAPVVFMSDFGTADDATAQCKGVIYSIAPDVRVIDATHGIPAFDIRLASFFLAEEAKVWPAGTVFLAVVDPGVGTARNPIVLKTRKGHYFVGPDNGIFTLPARRFGVEEVRTIAIAEAGKGAINSTFHGRDVFAPAAAKIAANAKAFETIGPVLASPVMAKWPSPTDEINGITGSLMYIEPAYGNVWTDIGEDYIKHIARNQIITIELAGRKIKMPLVATFGDVETGKPLAYINSRGYLSMAVNFGSFAKEFGAKTGDSVKFAISDSTFIDIEKLPLSNIHLDIRYATSNNFTKTAVYPAARCYLRKAAADGMVKAALLAEKENFSLCLLDCYRPLSVQEKFWALVPDERYVADPKKGSKHNRGMAVDVAACDANGVWLDLPTGFDDFSDNAAANSPAGTETARENRTKLQSVMKEAGFQIFPSEWWHFDFPGWENSAIENIPYAAD